MTDVLLTLLLEILVVSFTVLGFISFLLFVIYYYFVFVLFFSF